MFFICKVYVRIQRKVGVTRPRSSLQRSFPPPRNSCKCRSCLKLDSLPTPCMSDAVSPSLLCLVLPFFCHSACRSPSLSSSRRSRAGSPPLPIPLPGAHTHTGHKRQPRRWAGPAPGRGPAAAGPPLPARHGLQWRGRSSLRAGGRGGERGPLGGRQPKKGRRGLLPAGIPSAAYQPRAARSP